MSYKILTDLAISAIDKELEGWGVPVKRRPLELFKKVHGPVKNPKDRERLFSPINQWFLSKYGDDAQFDGVLGKVPLLIRDHIYEGLAMWQITGEPGEYKKHILDLPEEVSDSLEQDDFYEIAGRLTRANLAFRSFHDLDIDDHILPEEARQLFHMGLRDLETAVSVLVRDQNFQGSIVASHEAAEKFLKVALLRSSSTKSPRSFQHDIPSLFKELTRVEPRYAWLIKPAEHIQLQSPDMQMRYKPAPRTANDAVATFYGSLYVCGVLAHIWLFDFERGAEVPIFKECRFYRNETGRHFYCKKVSKDEVTLVFFESNPKFGSQTGDILLGKKVASLYLEVKEPIEDARLRSALIETISKANRKVELPDDEVAVELENGVEGSHTSLRIRRKRERQ